MPNIKDPYASFVAGLYTAVILVWMFVKSVITCDILAVSSDIVLKRGMTAG